MCVRVYALCTPSNLILCAFIHSWQVDRNSSRLNCMVFASNYRQDFLISFLSSIVCWVREREGHESKNIKKLLFHLTAAATLRSFEQINESECMREHETIHWQVRMNWFSLHFLFNRLVSFLVGFLLILFISSPHAEHEQQFSFVSSSNSRWIYFIVCENITICRFLEMLLLICILMHWSLLGSD